VARPAKPSEQEQKVNIKMNDLLKETGNAGSTCTDKMDGVLPRPNGDITEMSDLQETFYCDFSHPAIN
jgi:hypothetical protein